MAKPGALFHIGMMKAASTTLQRTWRANDDINLLLKELRPWRKTLDDRPESEVANALRNIHRNSRGPDKFTVFSREGLMIDDHEKLSRIIADLFPEAEILVITRNPKDFLRSFYQKNIQSGFAGTLVDFARDRRSFLKKVYNFSGIAKSYGARGIAVHFLPFELIKTDKERLGRELEAITGIAHSIGGQGNRTPPYEMLEVIRLANSLNEMIFKGGAEGWEQQYRDTLKNSKSVSMSQLRKIDLEQFRPVLRSAEDFRSDVEKLATFIAECGLDLSCLSGIPVYDDFTEEYGLE